MLWFRKSGRRAMDAIKLQQRADENGLLRIQVPTALPNRDLEVIIVLQPLEPVDVVPMQTANENGWPKGFLEQTYGSLADDPLERLPQGKFEAREAVEIEGVSCRQYD